MNSTIADVAVIGAGPAGIATALALLDKGLSVTLVERSGYDERRIGEHLTPDAYGSLDRLGVLKKVRAGPHLEPPVFQSVWGDNELVTFDYIFNPNGGGLTLARPAFDLSLVAESEKRGGQLLSRCKIDNIDRNGNEWVLSLVSPEGEQTLHTTFLVDATGRAAWLSRKMGERPTSYDQLVGLATLLPSEGDNGGALLEALHEGWWYTSLLPEGELVAIFLTDSDLIKKWGKNPGEYWIQMLAESKYTHERLDAMVEPGNFRTLPAMSQRLLRPVGDGWLAVGDAAMAADPLSSGGIAKGLKGGLQAATAIEHLLKGDEDPTNDYVQDLKQGFDDYLDDRLKYYRMETRWPEAPFWTRRHKLGMPMGLHQGYGLS